MDATANHWHKPDRLKRCVVCDQKKPLQCFYRYSYVTKQGRDSFRYESRCKPCARQRRIDQYRADPVRDNQSARRWKSKNRVAISDYNARRQAEPKVRELKAFHQRLRKGRMRSSSSDDAAIRQVYRQATEIERIVAACPVFDLPELGHKMHVDHIVPLARGGKHEASNLQILPAGINLRKGAR